MEAKAAAAMAGAVTAAVGTAAAAQVEAARVEVGMVGEGSAAAVRAAAVTANRMASRHGSLICVMYETARVGPESGSRPSEDYRCCRRSGMRRVLRSQSSSG